MRAIVLAAALALTSCPAFAAGDWTPDDALVAKIETAFVPIMTAGLTNPGGRPAPVPATLDKYTRYYAGETVDGEQVVVGAFLYDWGRAPAGIQFVTMKDLPGGAGGGCSIIHVWYHVATGKIESTCNFAM